MRLLLSLCSRALLHRSVIYQTQLLGRVRTYSSASDSNSDKYSVKTFGSIRTRTGELCNINIRPVDPQKCPDQNIAYVSYAKSLRSLKVLYTDECLSIDKDPKPSETKENDLNSVSCCIQVPIKFDVDVAVVNNRSVTVENLDNDLTSVATELGFCHLKKILTRTVEIQTRGGDILSESILQGNATLTTEGSGKITVSKLLCQYFMATTQAGDINIKSLYADESRLSSESGNIDIGSAHRAIQVGITGSGNLNIGSLDGSLLAELKEGNVSIHISRHAGVDISTDKGDIELRLPDDLMTRIELKAHNVSIDEQLNSGELNWANTDHSVTVTGVLYGSSKDKDLPKGLPTIRASTASGQITLIQQDWFSSLKLTTLNKELS